MAESRYHLVDSMQRPVVEEVPPSSLSAEPWSAPQETARTTWWWEAGPVDSCCLCIPLRTGIILLALDHMLGGLLTFNLAGSLSQRTEGGKPALVSIENQVAILYMFGLVRLCLGVVGLVAACKAHVGAAKLFICMYPLSLLFSLYFAAVFPVGAIDGWCLALGCFFATYYGKVTWSFYSRLETHKRRVADEEAEVAGGMPLSVVHHI